MRFLIPIILAASFTDCHAVALKRENPTDDSVCDLGPNTTAGLGRRNNILIPATASSVDQSSALFRLAGRFVADQCRNGQLMILHGEAASQIDITSLSQLANSSCVVAAIERREVAYNTGFGSDPGFELRCMIVKHAELNAALAELERKDPFDQLLLRMGRQAGVLKSPEPATASSTAMPGPGSQASKCKEMSLSSTMGKGSCSN